MSYASGFAVYLKSLFKKVTIGDVMFWILMVGVVLNGLLFFIPGTTIFSGKSFIIIFVALIAVGLSLIHIFRSGIMSIPKDLVIYTIAGMGMVSIISAALSGAPRTALWGALGESTSALSLVTLVVLFFLAFRVFRNTRRGGIFIALLSVISLILLGFHSIRFFFGTEIISFKNFTTVFGTPAGTWLDLGIIFSLAIITATLVLEFRLFRPLMRKIIGVLGGLFLVFLFIMNIRDIWIGLGCIALMLIISIVSFAFWNGKKETFTPDRRLPLFTVIVFIVSLVGLFFGPIIQKQLDTIGSVQPYGITHPTLKSTFRAGVFSTQENFVTGVSPAQFRFAFVNGNTFTPQALDTIDRINFGFSWVTTIIATTGILGILMILLVFFALGRQIFFMAQHGFQNSESRFFTLTFLSLWLTIGIFSLISVPSFPVLALGALLMGAWYRLWTMPHPPKDFATIPLLKDPKSSFFGFMGLLISLGIVLMILSVVVRIFVSDRALLKSIRYERAGDFQQSLRSANRALVFWQGQESLRAGILVALREIGQNASLQKNPETTKNTIEQLSAQALFLAEKLGAQSTYDDRFLRFIGDLYRSFGIWGISGSYAKAINLYEKASLKSPHDTRITVLRARTLFASGQKDEARKLLAASLTKNPTVDGLRFQAELAIQDRNMTLAKNSLRSALFIRPNDNTLYRDLGILYYRSGEYALAESIFIAGLQKNPSLDILALSMLILEKQGRWAEFAKAQSILQQQTGNADAILNSLRENVTILTPTPILEQGVLEATFQETKEIP